MSDLNYLNTLVTRHLQKVKTNHEIIEKWQVKLSSVEGRGLIATKDISVDDLIYVDHPLIMGPRISEGSFVGCVVCYNTKGPTKTCEKGCGLLVCSKSCEDSSEHNAECDLINSWFRFPDKFVDEKKFIRNIVPLRSLLLDQTSKDFLLQLAFHSSSKHGSEVKFLKEHFDISESNEAFMLRTCYVLDANAYEMILTTDDKSNVTLRGLFPVSALMNHCCTPNVRCDFDSSGKMYIRATKSISADEEIFTSYTGLLWGTPVRRHHLKNTKDFSCKCRRCSDKTEFGSYLGALRCMDKKCSGKMLPTIPLESNSSWCCDLCFLDVNAQKMRSLQSAIGGFLSSTRLENVEEMYQLLNLKVTNLLPSTNHIVMDLKWKILSLLGDNDGFRWKELNTEWLNRAEILCRELLHPYKLLGLQRASQPARIQLVLHRCLLQKLRNAYDSPDPNEESHQNISKLEDEVTSTINGSFDVVKYDIFVKEDLEMRKNLANSDFRKLIKYDDDL